MIKNQKIGVKITASVIAIQILVLGVLYCFVNVQITKHIRENTYGYMQTIVEDRSKIIENYIGETESYLTAYSRAGEISDLLKDPNNKLLVNKAQKYTEVFSGDKENIEGIYASEWNTHVLAHTNPQVVGITTREGDALTALQNALCEVDGVYNTGIIMSPASGKQIVSMYRACYDDHGNPIGLVGGAVYTTGLLDQLNGLPIIGMENSKYYMVSAQTGEYIFNEDEGQLGVVAEEPYIKEILSDVGGAQQDLTGFSKYKADGEEYVVAYHYMADKGWVYIITDVSSEIFASINETKLILFVLCVIAIIILLSVTLVVIKKLTKPLMPIEKSLIRLERCDIGDNTEINKYMKRKDEVGSIAQATSTLIKSLQEIVLTLNKTSHSLDERTDVLLDSSVKLVDCVTDNISTTEELSASLETTDSAVSNVYNEVSTINEAVKNVVESLQGSSSSSDEMHHSAESMKDQAEATYENSKKQLEETKLSVNDAMNSLRNLSQINGMASSILDIAAQTNLLAINASIEAARSGEAGRGFAVVAEEIGKLADTSSSAAMNIQGLCSNANGSVNIVNECFENIISFIEEDIIKQFEDFATQSRTYSFSVDEIKKSIERVNVQMKALMTSVGQITDNINVVQRISKENKEAIHIIVDKCEKTAEISSKIKEQSDENTILAKNIKDLSHKFSMDKK